MKRKIVVSAPGIRIVAVISSRRGDLARSEVEAARDELADRLQEAAAHVRYLSVPRNRVVVR